MMVRVARARAAAAVVPGATAGGSRGVFAQAHGSGGDLRKALFEPLFQGRHALCWRFPASAHVSKSSSAATISIAIRCRSPFNRRMSLAVIDRYVLLDEMFETSARVFGEDLVPYRNHVYRVFNLSRAFVSDPEASSNEKLAIAAYFHDVGIWTDDTFDYVAPSVARALAWLAQNGRGEWSAEVSAMITEHHKVTSYRGGSTLVEAFRRADWVDVSLGLRSFGVDRGYLKKVKRMFPNAGFHLRLLRLGWRRLRSHPSSPLPMMKF